MCSCKVNLFRIVRILRENQELSNDTAHKYKSKTKSWWQVQSERCSSIHRFRINQGRFRTAAVGETT
uniref:Uncharacterized protein n=1 Tax=Anguilla anguilla TaxID=7936 RepID=A0A0E9SD62_ANGAN